ncbi:MAG TPA: YggT family protein [Nitrospiria bacterium]
MFVIANLLTALAQVIDIILSFFMWVIVIRAVISWVNPDPYNPIVQFLYRVTDPVLHRIRRFVPLIMGIDFSPIIAILIIVFLKGFIVTTLIQLAQGLR